MAMTENRVPAGVPTGGQFAASTKGVPVLDPLVDEDALDFARETLGPDATADEVSDLAHERAVRDAAEHESFF